MALVHINSTRTHHNNSHGEAQGPLRRLLPVQPLFFSCHFACLFTIVYTHCCICKCVTQTRDVQASAANPPRRLGTLLQLLQYRGMSLADPTARKGLHPFFIPIAKVNNSNHFQLVLMHFM
jgi:hypothetical protein